MTSPSELANSYRSCTQLAAGRFSDSPKKKTHLSDSLTRNPIKRETKKGKNYRFVITCEVTYISP